MPFPVPGFSLADPQSDALGWNVTMPQSTIGATLWVNNQSELDFDLWGNGSNYLGRVPAWMIYVPVRLPDIYSYVAFRFVQSLFVQAPVSESVAATLYEAREAPPLTSTPIALPRQSNQIRQARNIAVPMGLSHWYSRTATFTTGFSSVIDTWTPTAAQLASGYMGIYFYYGSVDAAQAATVQTNAFRFAIQWIDGGGAPVGGPFDLWTGRVTVGTDHGDHSIFNATWPLAYIGSKVAGNIPPTAAQAQFIVYVAASTGGNTTVNFIAAAFFDIGNAYLGDADIGFGNLWTPQVFEQAGRPFPFF